MPEIYLEEILEMVENTPNDFDLGEKIREYVNKPISESKSDPKKDRKAIVNQGKPKRES